MQRVGNVIRRLFPSPEHRIFAFIFREQTHFELLCDRVNLFLRLGNQGFFRFRYGRIAYRHCDGALRRILIALGFNGIEDISCHCSSVHFNALVNNFPQLFFTHQEINFKFEFIFKHRTIYITQILRNRLVENHSAHRGIYQARNLLAVNFNGSAHLDLGMQANIVGIIGHDGLFKVFEDFPLAKLAVLVQRQVIGAQNHILRRHGNRAPVRGLEQVARRQHKETRFSLRLGGQRHMNRHLIAVEVCVISSAGQRMQLQGPALDQHRLKSLNAQPVQRRRAVQQNRMVFNHNFQRVPNLGFGALHSLSRRLNITHGPGLHQALHHKGLEELQGHFLRQAALVHLQLRSDNNNGTSGVVDTLTEQVLAETPLLALQHIGKRFQRTVVRSCYRTAAAAIVDQGIHCLLKHTLFVAHNNIRRAQFKQPSQTIIAVDDAAVQIIQVGGGKTSAVQLYHRTYIRRNNRDNIHNHPFRAVPG
ncbi:MAG: hypothetical protein KH847_05745 [Clostridiales bacterium]|nr:hypothetical protein [Clostridiales bacterium]